MKHLRISFILILLFLPFASKAQQAIESVMKSIENSKSVTSEVYSEKRNPETKEIESASYVFEFTDQKLADKMIDAIRHERTNASTYEIVNRDSNRQVYTIKFDKKGSYSSYTLIHRGNSKWMLSIKKSSSTATPKTNSKTKSKTKIQQSRKRSKSHSYNSSSNGNDIETCINLEDGVMTFTSTDGTVNTIYFGEDI
ncbi:MAG: DUF5024 domain-containing protein [Bacteroides sp.]|nr:DUF5024 domain-containing protein [Bacteroides sp.]